MHACHDSFRSFLTVEAGNALIADLKSGLRLLFADTLHLWGRWREKLGRSQQQLGIFPFGKWHWVNITATPAWRARGRCLFSLLCPELSAGAHDLHLPETALIWTVVSISALLAMYDKPNDSLFIYHLPATDIISQTVLCKETICTLVLQGLAWNHQPSLNPHKDHLEDWLHLFLPWVLCFYYTMFNLFFNIVLYYKKYFFIIMFFLGDVFFFPPVFTSNCVSRFPQGIQVDSSTTCVKLHQLRLQVCSVLYFYLR